MSWIKYVWLYFQSFLLCWWSPRPKAQQSLVFSFLSLTIVKICNGVAGREITAGQRTMSGQNEQMSGQTFAWPVILTGHFGRNRQQNFQFKTNFPTREVKNIPCLLCLIILSRISTFTARYHFENLEHCILVDPPFWKF